MRARSSWMLAPSLAVPAAAEAPESVPEPAPPAPSPLAAFLDDAEAALSELRELESEREDGASR